MELHRRRSTEKIPRGYGVFSYFSSAKLERQMGQQLKRYQDWPERLAAFVATMRDRPFAWGSWDCCLFVAAAIKEMTGVDFGEPFRATGYNDEASAYAIVAEYGSTEALWNSLLGKPVGWQLAQ